MANCSTDQNMEVIMNNKRRTVAIAAAVTTVLAKTFASSRRHSKLRKSRDSFAENLSPMVSTTQEPPPADPEMNEARAPGHRHLRWSKEAEEEPTPKPVRNRPFSRHQRGLRHPGRR